MLHFSERERAHSDNFKNVLLITYFQPYLTCILSTFFYLQNISDNEYQAPQFVNL